MACKGCAKRRAAAKQAVGKSFARMKVLVERVNAKKAREAKNAK